MADIPAPAPAGVGQYVPGASFEPPVPDPLQPEAQPVEPTNPLAPHLEAGQGLRPDVSLFLLAPAVWQTVNARKVHNGISQVLTQLDRHTSAEALVTLTSAMAGIIESEFPLQTWNAICYDMQVQLQTLLVNRAALHLHAAHAAQQTTDTPETTEDPNAVPVLDPAPLGHR